MVTQRRASSGQKEIKSLAKALEILFSFTRERPSLTVGEISRELGFPPSTTYRLVATLRDKGLVQQKPGTDSYMLGVRLLQLGDVIRLSLDLRHVALPFMQRLVQTSRETVVLVAATDSQATYLEMIESPEPMRVIPSDGMSFPLHCGATRRTLLAHMDPESKERYMKGRLRRYTPGTIVDKAELREDLERIIARGYAIGNQEIYSGARSLAAPVRDAGDRVVASIGIVGPMQRLTDERISKLLPSLLGCAEDISRALGARAGGASRHERARASTRRPRDPARRVASPASAG
jgi:IclR family KDG regulon transcriptional repressor